MRPLWLIPAAALTLTPSSPADEPPGKYRVVTPRDVGIIATGINGTGDVVGFEWVEDPARPGVVDQKPFYARGRAMTYLPLLAGYTSTSPAAVSDGGLVVGRASKPAPPGARVHMANQGFVWDAKAGIRGLGALADDTASFATGVSRDGRRVSGYSVGPGRIRACVWDRDGDRDVWKGTALPQADRLGSHTVAISGDGRYVAAVDGTSPCLWACDASGRWAREVIAGPGSLIPRAVNDEGMVVGLRFGGDGLPHAAVWARGAGVRALQEPAGYSRSEANAVNNRGVVVGMVDGPTGSKVRPRGFVAEGGRLRLLDEGGPLFAGATAVNDRGEVAGVLEEQDD
jgi:uncharacterized membrane protein